MSTPPAPPLVQLRGISRSFGGIQALSEVDLELRAGEVHALVGENGAGKSTLVKILTGVHQPDSGEILVAGEEQRIRSAHTAQSLGIAAMYQEPSVFLDLSVAENIFAGRRPRGLLGSVDWSQMNQRGRRRPRRARRRLRRPTRRSEGWAWPTGSCSRSRRRCRRTRGC